MVRCSNMNKFVANLTANAILQPRVMIAAVSTKSSWTSELNVAFSYCESISPMSLPLTYKKPACLFVLGIIIHPDFNLHISSTASSSQPILTIHPHPECRSQSVPWSPCVWVVWLCPPLSLTLPPISKLNRSIRNLSLIL